MIALLLALATAQSPGKAAFDEGMALFQAKAYQAARARFLEAYEVSGHRPSTVRALAQCERALGNTARAIALFEEYLKSAPPDAAQVKSTIRLLKRQQPEPELISPKPRAPPDPSPDPPPDPPPDPLALPPTPSASPLVDPSASPSPPKSSSTWIWWVAGGAVVAGALTATLLLLPRSPEPYGGTAGRVLER